MYSNLWKSKKVLAMLGTFLVRGICLDTGPTLVNHFSSFLKCSEAYMDPIGSAEGAVLAMEAEQIVQPLTM